MTRRGKRGRDKRGRRIGYNWWREYNMTAFEAAYFAVEKHREDNHQMEPEEYKAAFPLPRYKDFLIANKGMNQFPETEEPCAGHVEDVAETAESRPRTWF